MPIALPEGAVMSTRRTLGSFAPHPANIGKVAGAHMGIAAPRMAGAMPKMPKMQLASGGIANAENIGDNIFTPINPGIGVPNVDVNFITSPKIQGGSGPPRPPSSTPQKQPDPMQQVAEGTATAGGLTSLYNQFGKGIASSIPTELNPASAAENAGLLSSVNAAPGSAELLSTIGAGGAADAAAAETAAASSMPAWLTSLLAFAEGGAIPARADGGKVGDTYHHSGLLNSAGPGRTDTINTHVPAGAYVIPADIISGLGQGNTMSGSAIIDRMFPPIPNDKPAPDKAPVVVAGGEHVLSPQQIINKFGSLKKGHASLDHWIVIERQKIAKEISKLPNPVGSKVKKK